MTLIEAAKQARDALETFGHHYGDCPQYPTYTEPENYPPCNCGFEKALTALDQAIAKAEQEEPVAWMYDQARFGPTDLRGQQWLPALSRLKPWNGDGLVRNVQPLYTSPPASKPWVGLTDEEQTQVAWSCGAMSADWLEFARAIEAKLKEKNT